MACKSRPFLESQHALSLQEVNRQLSEHSEWCDSFDDEGYERWHEDAEGLPKRHDEFSFTVSEQVQVVVAQRGWSGGGWSSLAYRVWECGVALSEYMLSNRDIVCGEKVLDLGSGTGITGLVAAECGALNVLITDLPDVMPLINENVARHVARQQGEQDGILQISTASFDWSKDATLQGIPLDHTLCIFSDCLYDDDMFCWLRASLLKVVAPGRVALFSYRIRIESREKPYFSTLAEDFDICVQPALPTASQFDMRRIYICIAVRK